jgi:hypothetical protein
MQEAVPQARGPDKGKRKRQEEDHSRTMEILYLCAFGLTYMDSPVGESLAPRTFSFVDCPSTDQAGLSAIGEIRQNIKLAAFWCVLLTKIKVDPEILSIKQLRKKKIPKDNLTRSRSRI